MLNKLFFYSLFSLSFLTQAMEKEQDFLDEENIEEIPLMIWPKKFCNCITTEGGSYLLDLIYNSKILNFKFISGNCNSKQIKLAKILQKQKQRKIASDITISRIVTKRHGIRLIEPYLENELDINSPDFPKYLHLRDIIAWLKYAKKYRYHALFEKLLFWRKQQYPTREQINKFCKCMAKKDNKKLSDIISTMQVDNEDIEEICSSVDLEEQN